MRQASIVGLTLLAVIAFSEISDSAPVYSEDFEIDPTVNWVVNSGPFQDLGDNTANFFFDYSTVGIPLAPNSKSGGSRGLNLQANQDVTSDGIGVPPITGISVSPLGQDFSGLNSFRLKFDLWQSFPGPFPQGSNGTTQLSTFGIGTSGNFSNYPGSIDGVVFAASTDGGSSADFRAYSSERAVSYQLPVDPSIVDGDGNPVDGHATFYAGSRSNSAALYADHFGGVAAPPEQLALYPQQAGVTALGATGMAWHEVEITKLDNFITWSVDQVVLASVDIENLVVPLGGGNILFGHADINGVASTDPLRFELLFSLVDNIEVTAIPEPHTLGIASIGIGLTAWGRIFRRRRFGSSSCVD
ncbi:MAG: hypothetical protein AB7G28_25765 [Pirellulales bacterium]